MSTPPAVPSPRRISLAWAAAGAALALSLLAAAAIACLVLAAASFHEAGNRAGHLARVQDATDDSLQSVVDMETGIRAYLLTGQRVVLAPWFAGRSEFARSVRRLEQQLEGDRHEPLARRLAAAGRTYIDGYGGPLIDLRATRRLPASWVATQVLSGKRRVDAIRRLARGVESAEQLEASSAITSANRVAGHNRTLGIAALLAAVLVVLGFGAMLWRGLLRPLAALRQAADRLSAGDLSVSFDTAASRELEPVGSAFAQIVERGQALVDDLEAARLETLQRLARATEYRDDDTHEHTERVGRMAALLGRRIGLDAEQLTILRLAAPLHDVGKIGVPDSILLKPGRLTKDEFWQMQRHTTFGSEMLSGSPSIVLRMAEKIALAHHERWDGSGYPLGLPGEDIPLVGRIVAVADVFDALTHERPYKHAWTVDEAVAEIEAQAGRQFDPQIAAALISLPREELVRAATSPAPPRRTARPADAVA